MIVTEAGVKYTDEEPKNLWVIAGKSSRRFDIDKDGIEPWVETTGNSRFEVHHGKCGLGSVNASPVWFPKHAQPIVGECTCIAPYPVIRTLVRTRYY